MMYPNNIDIITSESNHIIVDDYYKHTLLYNLKKVHIEHTINSHNT